LDAADNARRADIYHKQSIVNNSNEDAIDYFNNKNSEDSEDLEDRYKYSSTADLVESILTQAVEQAWLLQEDNEMKLLFKSVYAELRKIERFARKSKRINWKHNSKKRVAK
jgi:hypothetical protein